MDPGGPEKRRSSKTFPLFWDCFDFAAPKKKSVKRVCLKEQCKKKFTPPLQVGGSVPFSFKLSPIRSQQPPPLLRSKAGPGERRGGQRRGRSAGWVMWSWSHEHIAPRPRGREAACRDDRGVAARVQLKTRERGDPPTQSQNTRFRRILNE